MNYSSLTVLNKNFIKRFSHKQRFVLAANLIEKYKPRTILDYGAGDGELLKHLKNLEEKDIFLFEPIQEMIEALKDNLKSNFKYKIISNKKNLNQNFFDIIIINEVFEHLRRSEIEEILQSFLIYGKKNVKIIVSVPIEIGISSLFKNFVRILTGQSHENTSFKNIIKSFFSCKIERPNIPYNNSHIGFNYKKLIVCFKKQNFEISHTLYSPFNILKGFLNSQVFFVLEKVK